MFILWLPLMFLFTWALYRSCRANAHGILTVFFFFFLFIYSSICLVLARFFRSLVFIFRIIQCGAVLCCAVKRRKWFSFMHFPSLFHLVSSIQLGNCRCQCFSVVHRNDTIIRLCSDSWSFEMFHMHQIHKRWER